MEETASECVGFTGHGAAGTGGERDGKGLGEQDMGSTKRFSKAHMSQSPCGRWTNGTCGTGTPFKTNIKRPCNKEKFKYTIRYATLLFFLTQLPPT